MSGLPAVENNYLGEVARKGIHLLSLSIPIVYFFIDRSTALAILVPLTVVVGAADLARLYHPGFRTLYSRLFDWLLRPHERDEQAKRLNGATYVLLSACLCIIIFPKVIVITAFSLLIISDTSAALIGRKFGSRPFLKKSFEGTLAFFLSGLLVVAFTPKVEYLPLEYILGGAAALLGAFVEAFSISIDDNLSIPLSIGVVLWAMYSIFLPGLNVYALEAMH
jgi:dolichol kinase